MSGQRCCLDGEQIGARCWKCAHRDDVTARAVVAPITPMFTFSVQAKIVPAVRMTQRGKYKSVQAGRYLAYKERVGWEARLAGATIMDGPITLSVSAYAHKRRWDASNVLKGIEDALNGVCWHDDKQIVDAHITVMDCDDTSVDVVDVVITGTAGEGGG